MDARIVNLEIRVEQMGKIIATQIQDFGRFVEASKKDWRDLRNFLTKMIEGN